MSNAGFQYLKLSPKKEKKRRISFTVKIGAAVAVHVIGSLFLAFSLDLILVSSLRLYKPFYFLLIQLPRRGCGFQIR
jgi:hypothetical protein